MRFQQWSETETRTITPTSVNPIPRLTWPDAVAYQEAIQTPSITLADPYFKTASITLDKRGLPVAYAGRFAVVFKMKTEDNETWAFRCFTTPGDGQGLERAARYKLIQRYAEANRNIFVPFRYMEQGIKIGRNYYPALAMRWASGEPMGRWVETNRNNPEALRTLCSSLSLLLAKLESAGIAHGDWQHDNLLVADGGKRITLVDYDGMYVPELAGKRSEEIGHPNYQHPARTADHFGPGLDRFACLVVQTSLLGIARSPELWDRYSDGESLLFQRSDFISPETSSVFRELSALAELDQDEMLADAVARLQDACHAGAMSTLLPGIDAPVEELATPAYAPMKPAAAVWLSDAPQALSVSNVPTTNGTNGTSKTKQWWTLPEVVTKPVVTQTVPRTRTVTVAPQDTFTYIERARSQETLKAEENHVNSWRFGLALFAMAVCAMVFAQSNGLKFFMAGPFFALLVNLGTLGYNKWPRKAIYDELSEEIKKIEGIIDTRKKMILEKGGVSSATGAGSVGDFVADKMAQTSINRVLTVPGVKVYTLRVLREAKIDNAYDLQRRGTIVGVPAHQMTALQNWCQEREEEAVTEYRKTVGIRPNAPAEVARLRHEVAEFERHLGHLKRERDQFPEIAFNTYFRRLFGAEKPATNTNP